MEETPAKAASAPPSAVHRPASYVERLDLARLFSRLQPLEVELGCGDGSFLVQWAKLHPEHNYLGVERLLGRLRKVDRKAQRAGLANVQLMRIEASYFMEYLLPPESVLALHIYFPDPWPKRRHRKHRLVNEHFVEVAARMLIPQGTVFLRTDNPDYFGQMKSVFESHPRFHEVETSPDLGATLTDFERDFQTRGVATLRAAYQCTPLPQGRAGVRGKGAWAFQNGNDLRQPLEATLRRAPRTNPRGQLSAP